MKKMYNKQKKSNAFAPAKRYTIEESLQKWPSPKSKMVTAKKPSETVKQYKVERYGGSIKTVPYKMDKVTTRVRDEMVKAQMKAFKSKAKKK